MGWCSILWSDLSTSQGSILDRMSFSILTCFAELNNICRAWKLYNRVTVPRKEDLILVGNPDKRTSKLVYILADQAEYCMLDISEIPFVTLATTQNIIGTPPRMAFGQEGNDFQFTFEIAVAAPRSQIQTQTPPVISTPSVTVASLRPQGRSQLHTAIASLVATYIKAVTSYFASPSSHTPQKCWKMLLRRTPN